MDSTKRIVLNTIAQYSRSVLNILLSLFSTRYIIEALGNSDYGLYVLVGGIVAMLGFVTNALVITTQRFVSFYFGKKDQTIVKIIFANSLCVHILVSILLAAFLFSLKDYVVYNLLNIPSEKIAIAADIYGITVGMLVITIMSAPYKALLIAHENITYISIIEICDGFIKLAIALLVLTINMDKLYFYAIFIFAIQFANFFAFAWYAIIKYHEAKVFAIHKYLSIKHIKQLMGFAGWSTYGMAAIVSRNQGIQWLLNNAYNTIMNAAYGIATQVYGSLSFIASSVLNAMNPQIMKAEGEGKREKMLFLAEMASKYSTMLLSLIIVPLIMEMPAIINFWLKNAPQFSDMFCQFILIGFMIDQITYGLNIANQATGRIKMYTILMYTPKLLVLIPIFILLRNKATPVTIMYIYILSEAIVSGMRLPYIKITCGLKIREYIKNVIFPIMPLLITEVLIGYFFISFINIQFRFLLTIPISIICGSYIVWLCSLTSKEKEYIKKMLYKKKDN